MKIRTDFVTNSSATMFILNLGFYLTNGTSVYFCAHNGTGYGIEDYFRSDIIVNVSPKQLGEAKTVEEMIQLLANGVLDGHWDKEKLFKKPRPIEAGDGEIYDAYDFIKEIREEITSMDEIEEIYLSGEKLGDGGDTVLESEFTYNMKTKEYTGEENEWNGIWGEDDSEINLSDLRDCDYTIIGHKYNRWGLRYDDDYYDEIIEE